jgi:galactose mutarotase-like enzyme
VGSKAGGEARDGFSVPGKRARFWQTARMTRRDDATPASPSADQITIAAGGTEAVVVTLGAALRTLTQDGGPLVDGFTADEPVPYGRGQLCIPWPNRISKGRYTWDGVEIQAPINEPSREAALHGLVRWAIWDVRAQAADSVVLGYRVCPQDGYPFLMDFEIEYAVGAAGLAVTLTATNKGVTAAPYGFATHPYLRVGDHHIDDCSLQLSAKTVLLADELLRPTERIAVTGTPYDFNGSPSLAGRDLDNAFTGIDVDSDGLSWTTLWGPGGVDATSMWWVAENCSWFQACTGDVFLPEWRRRGVALEPMTCPPNAFQTGEDVIRIEPGAASVVRWGIQRGPQPGLAFPES